jgi:hypothetical protein
MDTMRGNFGSLAESDSYDPADDDTGREAPPLAIGQDERRMQVRAYNHWASLLEDRNFPSIEDLEPGNLPDFGPYSVLLDFSSGIEDPGITYLGEKLALECDVGDSELSTLADVPARSLLSRITDHYMQIIANQAPIGFEAEFVNQRGMTIAYRGILLPYSSDDDTIDFIYGVINWKELAEAHAADELLLEIDQALQPKIAPGFEADAPLTDWADGPGAVPANDMADEDDESAADSYPASAFAGHYEGIPDEDDGLPVPSFGLGEDEDEQDDGEDEDADDEQPARGPQFGSLLKMPIQLTPKPPIEMSFDDDFDEGTESILPGPVLPQAYDPEAYQPEIYAPEIYEPETDEHHIDELEADETEAETLELGQFEEPLEVAFESTLPQALDAEPELEPEELEDVVAATAIELAVIDPAEMELGDWLASAREMATAARGSEERTREALYDAIGLAYDFSLAAAEQPVEFDEILADSGLTVQDRAPMTPVVKLVFGADYDKTRLTEYGAALTHAHRLELPRGTLGEYLGKAEGGLKGVVQAERRLRKEEAGKAVEPVDAPRAALARKLRAMPPQTFDALDPEGCEFALVMIRRTDEGEVVVLGEIPDDVALVERAARRLIG